MKDSIKIIYEQFMNEPEKIFYEELEYLGDIFLRIKQNIAKLSLNGIFTPIEVELAQPPTQKVVY